MGITDKIWKATRNTYSHPTETINIGEKKSKTLQLKNGIRQGSVLSPLLFIIFMNTLIARLIKTGKGVDAPEEEEGNIPCMMFADDLQLMTTIPGNLDILIKTVIK